MTSHHFACAREQGVPTFSIFLHCRIGGKLIRKMRNGTLYGAIILFAACIIIHACNIRTMRGALY